MPKRVLRGVVVGDRANKTITVKVERRVPHPVYKKIVTVSKNYSAHDENNIYKIGDIVKISECKPISKTKKWEVVAEAA